MFLLGWKKSTQFWSYLPLKVYENKADTLFISDTCTGTRALKMCSWASIFIDRRLLELWWNGKTASFRLVLLWKDAFLRSSIIQTCLSKRYFSEKTFFSDMIARKKSFLNILIRETHLRDDGTCVGVCIHVGKGRKNICYETHCHGKASVQCPLSDPCSWALNKICLVKMLSVSIRPVGIRWG